MYNKKEKKVVSENLQLDNQNIIEDLDNDSTYKYLGIEENSQIQHKTMRTKITKEYIKRVKKVCKSNLTSKNKITAINQLAVPVITYGIGIIDWPQGDLNNIDTKTRKILTMNKVTYRNQCLDRIYIPRREGGLGLIEINQAYRSTIISLGTYIKCSQDDYLKFVAQQHREILPQQTSIIKLAENFNNTNIEENQNEQTPATKKARLTRVKYCKNEETLRKERWKQHQRAGKFQKELEEQYIDKDASLQWLRSGGLGFDTERIIVGAQDQGLLTNGFKKLIGISQNDKCRFCHTFVESVNHLVSGCQILMADGHYTKRHNNICKYIHWKICKEFKIDVKEKLWDHEPQPVTADTNTTIFYDKIIPTGRYIENNAIKPDIVIWDRKNKTALIIDVTVPNDYGVCRAEREKITKYQHLKYDLKTTWSLQKIDVIPVVVGATGVVTTRLKEYLKSIPGSLNMNEIQLNAVRGTAGILKRALGC